MIIATQVYHTEVVQLLAESEADLNLQNEVSYTVTVGIPLELQCINRISPHQEGLTALMIAVKRGALDLTNTLLRGGCDIDVQENVSLYY